MPTSTTTTQRISALSNHLTTSPNPEIVAKTMATEKKPPITCHVLDTTIGKPASNIPVTLTLYVPHQAKTAHQVLLNIFARTVYLLIHKTSHNPAPSTSQPTTFSATTNSDGRVTSWTPSSSAPFTDSVPLETLFHATGDQRYSLTFNTESYFGESGVKTFFPEVEVKFVVREEQKGEHFHVPVLVGGFGYTTYRGS